MSLSKRDYEEDRYAGMVKRLKEERDRANDKAERLAADNKALRDHLERRGEMLAKAAKVLREATDEMRKLDAAGRALCDCYALTDDTDAARLLVNPSRLPKALSALALLVYDQENTHAAGGNTPTEGAN